MIAAAALALTLLAPIPVPGSEAPKQTTSDRPSREAVAARSARAQDQRGPLPSLYRGRYFHASQESFRLCVGHREGSFTYMVRGGDNNGYFGTYQMSAALVRGVSWMMASESKRTHDGLYREARSLLTIPGNRWSRYWQDRAFSTILNFEGMWSGRHHWSGGRWSC